MDEFSICFSEPLTIDMELFELWVNGLTVQEASKKFSSLMPSSVNDVPFSILQMEVVEQYTLFNYLEKFLQNPWLLNSPILSSMSLEQKEELLEHYYEFNKDVMREILGKKMSAKLRKDMDDVSEKTGKRLQSCRRQFDNVKTILKTYEDMEDSLNSVLKNHFYFSQALVQKYYPLVFVFLTRFETTKKKLTCLCYDDIITCTEHILEKWTFAFNSNPNDKTVDLEEIDRHFAQDLRDLRNIVLERDFQDAHKSALLTRLEKKATTMHFTKSLEGNSKSILRNIFQLGGGLTHTRDVRDFFIDCIEKIIEPIKNLEWAIKELELFLDLSIDSWGDLKGEHRAAVQSYDGVFIRFMEVMKKCILQLYR